LSPPGDGNGPSDNVTKAIPNNNQTAEQADTSSVLEISVSRQLEILGHGAGDFTSVSWRDNTGWNSETVAAAQAVDDAVARAEQRATQAAAHVDQVRKGLSPVGDAAAELRASRYWHRTERQLDGVEDGRVLEAARDLVAKANTAELGTLLEELGGYLTARGQSTDWVDGVVAEKIPELHKAREALRKAVQAKTVIQYNASQVHGRIAGTRAPNGYRAPILVDVTKYDPDSG
jgi:hypothetical protein